VWGTIGGGELTWDCTMAARRQVGVWTSEGAHNEDAHKQG